MPKRFWLDYSLVIECDEPHPSFVETHMALIPFAALLSTLAIAVPQTPPKAESPSKAETPPSAKDEGPGTVEQQWKDLAGGDAQKAYSSIWAMVKSQTESVSFL